MTAQDLSGSNWTPENTNQTPENGLSDNNNNGSNLEKQYHDTKNAFTQTRQALIDFAKSQVDANPAAVEQIPDKAVQKKVLQDKWGVESLEELKIANPEIFSSEEDASSQNNQDDDKISKVERELNLMKYREIQTKTKEAIESLKQWSGEDIAKSIPDFDQKIKEEMDLLSDKLTPFEKAKRAFKIVVDSSDDVNEGYRVLIGQEWVKSTKSKESNKDIEGSALMKALNEI